MMKRTCTWIIPVSLVCCLLVIAPVPAATGEALDLAPPDFITTGGSCTEPAFNASTAGIASHVKVSQTINLNDAVSAYDQILEWDDTHALGEIWILGKYTTFKPLVYIDTSGNIVAYYRNKTLASSLVSWNGVNLESPVIADFTTNQAIWEMCNKTGISYSAIKSSIRYYHFGFPGAQKILVFANGIPRSYSETTHLSVPASFTMYEASGTLACGTNNGWYPTYLSVDSVTFTSTGTEIVFDYGPVLNKGTPHTLTISNYEGAAGTVIVYSEG